MTPIREAKDLILMNYVNSTMERLNKIAIGSKPDPVTELIDSIYSTHYVPLQMHVFSYWEVAQNGRSEVYKALIRHYRNEFRDSVYRFDEMIGTLPLEGVPCYEQSEYASASIRVDGRIDRTRNSVTKSRRKKEELGTDIVFFDDERYYEIVIPDESRPGRYREIRKFAYSVPRFIPF